MKTTNVAVRVVKRSRNSFVTSPSTLYQALKGAEAVSYGGITVGGIGLRTLTHDLCDGEWLLKVSANSQLEVETFYPRRPRKLPHHWFALAPGAWLKGKQPQHITHLVPKKWSERSR